MITITVKKRQGNYISFESKGHAGYGHSGRDIVCAAVSALIINTFNSIETFTEDTFDEKVDDGYVYCEFTSLLGDSSRLLMDSLVLGLTQIQKDYNNKYLEVRIREV